MPLESFNRVKGHSAWRLVGIVCALIGGPALVVVGLYGFYYRREKRILQWGKAVPARIVGEHTTQTRSGPVAKVTYSFEDDRGVTRQSMKTLPASDDLRPDFAEERARYLNNPTVVFGPGNSKRHVLFPGTLLQVN